MDAKAETPVPVNSVANIFFVINLSSSLSFIYCRAKQFLERAQEMQARDFYLCSCSN